MNNEPGLTLRDLVLEVRSDVKELKENTAPIVVVEDHEARLRLLETSSNRFGGALTFIAAGVAVCAAISAIILPFIVG